MMTSSNGNIFRVTGPLCGEFTGPGEFPAQRPVTRSFDVFCDLCWNKRLSKQSWGWWFETQSGPLWRHRNEWKLPKPIKSMKSMQNTKPRKNMNWQTPNHFLNKFVVKMLNLEGKYTYLCHFVERPGAYLRGRIFIVRNCDATKHYRLFTA